MSNLFLIGNGFDLACGLKTSYRDAYNVYFERKSANEVIKKFKNEIESDYPTWADFEEGIAKYAGKVNSEEEIIMCVRDFRDFLVHYLYSQQTSFFRGINNDANLANNLQKEMRRSIESFYKGNTNNINRIAGENSMLSGADNYFVSFNYTRVFDQLLSLCVSGSKSSEKKYKIDQNVVHIHGKLEDEDCTLGIDNENQLDVKYGLTNKGKRALIKPIFNNLFDSARVSTVRSYMLRSYNVCVFGMSLGESDLTWRSELLSWLVEDKRRQLFLYDYRMTSANKANSAEERMSYEDEYREELAQKWNTEKYGDILGRIHIPYGRDKTIFRMDEALSMAEAANKTVKAN